MRKNEVLIFRLGDDTVKLYNNAALDELYAYLFDKAKRRIRRDPWMAENSIQGIIFGCFYVEARSNSVLRQLLKRDIDRQELASKVWQSTKRSSIVEKLELLRPFASDKVKEQSFDVFPKVKRAFDLRNRLAHFKDKDNFVGEGNLEDDGFLEMINNAPYPDVLSELEPPKIDQHLSALTDAKLWISYVFRRQFNPGPVVPLTQLSDES